MTGGDLDDELDQLTGEAIRCRFCGVPYPEHGDAGGPIRRRVGGFSSPAAAIPVGCPGFRWVDPGGPPVGSYSDPPSG